MQFPVDVNSTINNNNNDNNNSSNNNVSSQWSGRVTMISLTEQYGTIKNLAGPILIALGATLLYFSSIQGIVGYGLIGLGIGYAITRTQTRFTPNDQILKLALDKLLELKKIDRNQCTKGDTRTLQYNGAIDNGKGGYYQQFDATKNAVDNVDNVIMIDRDRRHIDVFERNAATPREPQRPITPPYDAKFIATIQASANQGEVGKAFYLENNVLHWQVNANGQFVIPETHKYLPFV